MAIGGKEATKVYDGMKVFGLAVRFPENARNDVDPIQNILIATPSGALIPLGQVAKVLRPQLRRNARHGDNRRGVPEAQAR